MKVFVSILVILFSTPLSSYREKNCIDLENEKYLNFVSAIENESTVGYFTVVKIKNLNNGQIKEVCSKGKFLIGALHQEMRLGYDNASRSKVLEFARSKKDRYFELKNNKALQNISFFDYKTKLVGKIRDEYDIDKAVSLIRKEREFEIRLPPDKMKALAHILFNKGIMTAENNCFGGSLYYVERDQK